MKALCSHVMHSIDLNQKWMVGVIITPQLFSAIVPVQAFFVHGEATECFKTFNSV